MTEKPMENSLWDGFTLEKKSMENSTGMAPASSTARGIEGKRNLREGKVGFGVLF